MNQLGTGSTGSTLYLTDSVSYEEHLALLWLVLTRPGSELSTVAFLFISNFFEKFLEFLSIGWTNWELV